MRVVFFFKSNPMNTVYKVTEAELAIARPFAERRAERSKAFYKKRGNDPKLVYANCVNGILGEFKAKIWLDQQFPQHRVSDVVQVVDGVPTWDPDLTITLCDKNGNETGDEVYVHVKSFVVGKYPEFPDENGNDRWVTPRSFTFQKTGLGGGHGDADMARIQTGGNSTDLLVGAILSCEGRERVPLDAIGDTCRLVGPFIMQQAVDLNLWKPPASRSHMMQMTKRVLWVDDLLTQVDVCLDIDVDEDVDED